MKIALIQSDLVWENKNKNLDHLDSMIEPMGQDIDLILLPEMFSTGFSMSPAGLAESLDGATVRWMHNWAMKKNSLIAGSLIIEEAGQYFNRFLAISSEGIIAQYDKRHLFRMAGEEASYAPGNKRVIFSWRGWRILPQICYDIRFPVWIRNQNDYDLALFVANWPEPRRDVWLTLLKARALENQAYVAGVNRIGLDGKGNNHVGDSQVLDPKGQILSSAGNQNQVIFSDLSMSELERFRNKFLVSLDRDDFSIST